MSAESPSDCNDDRLNTEDAIALPWQSAGETFVRTFRDHSGFCYWCLCPVEVNPVVQFTSEGLKDTVVMGYVCPVCCNSRIKVDIGLLLDGRVDRCENRMVV